MYFSIVSNAVHRPRAQLRVNCTKKLPTICLGIPSYLKRSIVSSYSLARCNTIPSFLRQFCGARASNSGVLVQGRGSPTVCRRSTDDRNRDGDCEFLRSTQVRLELRLWVPGMVAFTAWDKQELVRSRGNALVGEQPCSTAVSEAVGNGSDGLRTLRGDVGGRAGCRKGETVLSGDLIARFPNVKRGVWGRCCTCMSDARSCMYPLGVHTAPSSSCKCVFEFRLGHVAKYWEGEASSSMRASRSLGDMTCICDGGTAESLTSTSWTTRSCCGVGVCTAGERLKCGHNTDSCSIHPGCNRSVALTEGYM